MVNFVINTAGDRVVGVVDLEMRAGNDWGDPYYSHRRKVTEAPLCHLEYRRDGETGRNFVALVFELVEQ